VVALLLAVTLAAFSPALENGFVDYDDYLYVLDNDRVKAGLTPAGVAWAFTTYTAGNWHPLTWLSHMTDVQLFGLQPRGHHLTALLLHLLSTAVLFAVLSRMTGALWPSALAAALFGVHPLHVESVAWVSERKDVLCGLFWMLTLAAYLRYARAPRPGNYALTLFLFALGLMAKPMAVTLPLALLLLDFWPLGRLARRVGAGGSARPAPFAPGRVLLEKAPFLALACASAFITYQAQASGKAMYLMTKTTLGVRLGNALAAYAQYLAATVLPVSLAAIYPYRESGPTPATVAGSLALLTALSVTAVVLARRWGFVAFGWLWFLATLVPVIGLVQVGFQSHADRYTYLPLIGPFVALAFGAWGLARTRRRGAAAFGLAAAAIVALLSTLAWRQAGTWHDTVRLFGHAVEAVPDNWPAQHYLGNALVAAGRTAEGIDRYQEALRVKPDHVDSYVMIGRAYRLQHRLWEALAALTRAREMNPASATTLDELGMVLEQLGRSEEAVASFEQAIRLDPRNPEPYFNLGLAHLSRGDREAALRVGRSLMAVSPARAGDLVRLTGPGGGSTGR
jgi:Flp pilus assembly protein TadD